MNILLTILLLISIQISDQLEYARSVFPIPLMVSNDDPHFSKCPTENGIYAHTTNCSLFHMCIFGIHTVYTCIDRFFFNPIHNRCEYVALENETRCEIILEQMKVFSDFSVEYRFDDHRKSATSKCVQIGIYPDTLDCSLFHYCRENQQHDILKCRNNLHFDPKTFMCKAPELVNCQYEPIIDADDEINKSLKGICRDHPSDTYLPIFNRIDMYIICGNDGEYIMKRCELGFMYNALTTACEKGPCTFDSTLCQNDGRCVDEPMIEKGYRCICSSQFQGENCEKIINQEETTEEAHTNESIQKSSNNLLHKNESDETTHIPYSEIVHHYHNNQSIETNRSLDDRQQDKLVFSSNSQRLIKIIFIIIVIFIGIILFGSIIFGIITLTRIILYSPVEIFHEWKSLDEESNI
ncbi:hypothetical protein I4U23_000759 [Adineta vaga]|nr:hypothetical protein I4U23_000759 [Adineta vaga]